MDTSTAEQGITKLNLAEIYIESGLSIIPIVNGEKRPPIAWKKYQNAPPEKEKIHSWFGDGSNYELALVCGGVSNGLEVIDIDNHLNNATEVFNSYIELIKEFDEDLYNSLVIESTQSEGYHILYFCEEIEGNSKLATQLDEDGTKKTVIETRGEGGYLLSYPSNGYDLIQNSIEKIPFITFEQRNYLLNLAKSFDTVGTHQKETTYKSNESNNLSVGDDFNNRGDIQDILISFGWILESKINGVEKWKRPGKREKGHSATFNYKNSGLFYVFSSNAHPLESEKSYNKFALYTYLKHNGDFKEATKDLAKQGYGSQSKKMTKVNNTVVNSQDEGNLSEMVKELSFNHTKEIPEYVTRPLIELLFDWKINEMNKEVTITPIKENWEKLTFSSIDEREYFTKNVFPNAPMRLEDNVVTAVNDFISEFYSKSRGKDYTCNKAFNIFTKPDISKNYHPLQDYFISTDNFDLTKWKEQNPDEENPISCWFNRKNIPKKDTQTYEQYGEFCNKLEKLFTKWLIMVIQVVFGDRENDVALVLAGGQNTGKTTALRSLLPPELKDFLKTSIHELNTTDVKIAACENLFFFDDEGEALQRSNISSVKGLLSATQFKVRKPYGKGDELRKRVMSLMATENNDDFLKDETGSRRFLVIPIEDIKDNKEVESNLHFYKKSFNQRDFWGYVYSLYKENIERDHIVSFTKEDIQFTANLNKEYNESTVFDELIKEYCLPQDALNDTNKKHLQVTKILEELQKKTSIPIVNDRYAQTNLGKALQRNGYKKTSNGGVKGYWIGFRS
ncbi:MAG: VapE domain-containing protein [Chlorobiota bacterium]